MQLTGESLEVFLARWSPDGRHLVAMAREGGSAWRMLLLNADGGAPERLLREPRNEADPTWSPDGTRIAFGRTPDLMGHENGPKQIELLDLRTRRVEPTPGSASLFSPRWSPDGRWIAALTLGEQRLMLYNVAGGGWRELGHLRASDPVWARESSVILVHTAFSNPQAILRVPVALGAPFTIATLNTLP